MNITSSEPVFEISPVEGDALYTKFSILTNSSEVYLYFSYAQLEIDIEHR